MYRVVLIVSLIEFSIIIALIRMSLVYLGVWYTYIYLIVIWKCLIMQFLVMSVCNIAQEGVLIVLYRMLKGPTNSAQV